MVVNFPCKTCCKPVAKNHDNIQCNKRNTWVHRNCNKISKQTYRLLQKDKSSHWLCIICAKDFLPFSDLKNDEFIHTVKGEKVKFTHATKKKLTAEARTNTIYQVILNKLKWLQKTILTFSILIFPPFPIISSNYTHF